ncbi:ankyrin repeat domain-containing protein SOWAHB isoform X2 [Oryzias latipes]|uniref:ankyrin repeat domain-containing protein SOWAHB isoform X2 n=1 Tax=Oryzias latipes TaxID=8090 RepID=UPI000CE20A28|nr:ankyrin repeat domain-containing protein SOWAHB isoform X2 [Oryzias latipes]
MATHFTQDAVLHFLQSRGGSVKNAELLQHFRDFLGEHRNQNRDVFKQFVNSVATVRQIDGASYVTLRSKFRGGQAGPPAPLQRPDGGRTPAAAPESHRPRAGQEQGEAASRGPRAGALPSAGILPPHSGPQVSIAPPLPGGPRLAQGDPERGGSAVPERRAPASTKRGVSASPDRRASESLLRGAPEGLVRGGPPASERGTPTNPVRGVSASPDRRASAGLVRGAPASPVRGSLEAPDIGALTGQGRRAPAGPERGAPACPVRGVSVVPDRGAPASLVRGAPAGPVRGAPAGPGLGGPAAPDRGASASPVRGALVVPERRGPAGPERGGPSPVQNSLPGQQGPPPGFLAGPTSGGCHKKPNLQTPIQEPKKGSREQLQQQTGPQQERSPPPQTLHPVQVVGRHHRHRKSYKSAVSQDDDDEDDYGEEIQARGRGVGRAASTTPPCIVDTVAPTSVASSGKGPPQIYIQSTERQTPTHLGPPGAWQAGQPAEVRTVPCESTSTRRSVPLEAERHGAPVQCGDRTPPAGGSPQSRPYRRQGAPAQPTYRIPLHIPAAGGSPQLGSRQRQGAPTQHGERIQLHIAPPGGSPQSGPDQRRRLSPSHSGNASLSSDAQVSSSDHSLQNSPRRSQCSSSSEDLQAGTDGPGTAPEVQDGFQHSHRSPLTPGSCTSRSKGPPARHCSAGNLCDEHQSLDNLSDPHGSTDKDGRFPNQHMQWFFSTGDLYDNTEEAYSSEGPSCSPQLRPRPPAVRRVDSALRSRMCLSLGADLDQLQDMDPTGKEVARLVRLQRISSSLSLHRNLSSSSLTSCSTPPRSSSPAPLADNDAQKGGRGKASPATSTSTGPTNGQPSLVPLHPNEHSWMVKAASGAWGDIYSLFREDPSLLHKRDFISGFTVLHWIAKHGDHRVLNTLSLAAAKMGLSLDINAKSTAGQTPLHIAAIYNSKNIIRLLVNSYFADVRLRDTAGKRPWQYLEKPSPETLEVLGGAQQWVAEQKQLKCQREEASQPQKQRHHVRHQFSFATPKQRPLTYIGMEKVKRSTSLAAFLKRRSQPFELHKTESTA